MMELGWLGEGRVGRQTGEQDTAFSVVSKTRL